GSQARPRLRAAGDAHAPSPRTAQTRTPYRSRADTHRRTMTSDSAGTSRRIIDSAARAPHSSLTAAPPGATSVPLCEQVPDLGEELLLRRTRLRFGGDGDPTSLTLLELVHREDEGEVDDERDRDEIDDGGEDCADPERR